MMYRGFQTCSKAGLLLAALVLLSPAGCNDASKGDSPEAPPPSKTTVVGEPAAGVGEPTPSDEGACANCQADQVCMDGVCCTPKCSLPSGETAECGDDGCGGSCGNCPKAAPICEEGHCKSACKPNCEGKVCGDDGCGGTCGGCSSPQEICTGGQCKCMPDCSGKECGDDGCGGSCGQCTGAHEVCEAGTCRCQSQCSDKACGPDGCGGTCGVCEENFTCNEGTGECLSPIDLLKQKRTMAEALTFTKPLMSDEVDSVSAGALMFTVWATSKMRWDDVHVSRDETNYALVQKDSDEARGKRLCLKGKIIQISVTKTDFGKFAEGLIGVSYLSKLYHFIAVGSSGDLVQGKTARFCGVVTGKYDYHNSGGGMGHAVQIVGMFDLPENR